MDERLLQAQVIVFDIGNVLLRFQPEKACLLLPEEIRADVQHAMFDSDGGLSRWAEFDLGIIPNEEIAKDIALSSGHPGCEGQVLSMLEEFPKTMEIMPLAHLIGDLKKMGKRIYALTNYPEPSITRTVERFPFFWEMDGMVVSAREKMAKPDPRFFRLLLDRYHINPRDALFIDDRPENVHAAEELGIKGWLYTGC